MVSHSISPSPSPNASSSAANSLDSETPLMSRLSVLTVTRKRSRRSRSIGCSSMDGAAPVCTLDVGHISRGTRRSLTYEARRPSAHAAVGADGDVVDDAHAVAEVLGAAPLERLPDARQAEALAGVDREVEVSCGPYQVERVQMPRLAGIRLRDRRCRSPPRPRRVMPDREARRSRPTWRPGAWP